MSAGTTFEAHPAFDRLLLIYRSARKDWAAHDGIRSAADFLGMDERAYCDDRVRANQFSWAASDTTGPITQAHLDHAYALAVSPSLPEAER